MPSKKNQSNRKEVDDRHYALIMALVVAAVALRTLREWHNAGKDPGAGSPSQTLRHAKAKFVSAGVDLIAFTLANPNYYEQTHHVLSQMGVDQPLISGVAAELKRTHSAL